jgi:hypothetical protein
VGSLSSSFWCEQLTTIPESRRRSIKILGWPVQSTVRLESKGISGLNEPTQEQLKSRAKDVSISDCTWKFLGDSATVVVVI